MSGSTDAQLQYLLNQARSGNRGQSVQSRLAQAMMQQAGQQGPVWGTTATLARAVPGVLAGLMGGLAERDDQRREEDRIIRIGELQDEQRVNETEGAGAWARERRLPGAPPAPVLPDGVAGPPVAPQAPGAPDYDGAMAGLGSRNPMIRAMAENAVRIRQREDEQAFRRESLAIARANRPAPAPQRPAGPPMPPPPFAGNAMDAQALNILLRPDADSTSPAYEAAWLQVYGPRQISQADGSIITVQPRAPEGIRPPGRPAPPVAPAAPAADGAPVTPPVAAPASAASPAAPPQQSVQTPGGTVTRTFSAAPPMPAHVQRMESDDLEILGTAANINAMLAGYEDLMRRGQIPTTLPGRANAFIRNNAGASTEETRNLASFRADLERLRNESLRLNTGVQTEGDAQRAWSELIANMNDPAVVLRRLQEIQTYNNRAIELRQNLINTRRSTYNIPELDTTRLRAPAARPVEPSRVFNYTPDGRRIGN